MRDLACQWQHLVVHCVHEKSGNRDNSSNKRSEAAIWLELRPNDELIGNENKGSRDVSGIRDRLRHPTPAYQAVQRVRVHEPVPRVRNQAGYSGDTACHLRRAVVRGKRENDTLQDNVEHNVSQKPHREPIVVVHYKFARRSKHFEQDDCKAWKS